MKKKPLDNSAIYNFGIQMAATMAFFVIGGYFLDQHRGTGKFWSKVGVLIGLFFMGYEIWKLIQKVNK